MPQAITSTAHQAESKREREAFICLAGITHSTMHHAMAHIRYCKSPGTLSVGLPGPSCTTFAHNAPLNFFSFSFFYERCVKS